MENAKKSIITISGKLGSGKSTTAKRVAAALGYPHYSGGDFMRMLADKKNLSMVDFSKLAETDETIDADIDATQKEFMQANDNFVIDSRLGWFWEPKSFKVFLTLDDETAVSRVMDDIEHNPLRKGELSKDHTELLEKLRGRFESERARYKTYYGIENHFDPAHFDLVIDTKENDVDTVVQLVLAGFEKWKKTT